MQCKKKAVEVEIEYVDYMIARSISDLLREWIGSIKVQKPNAKIISMQKNSHYVTVIAELVFFSLALLGAILFTRVFLSFDTVNGILLAKYLLISGSLIVFARRIGFVLGRNIERKIDSINTNEMSFIHINSGDKQQYNEFQGNVKQEKLEAWKSAFIALGMGILSSIAAAIIYNNYFT